MHIILFCCESATHVALVSGLADTGLAGPRDPEVVADVEGELVTTRRVGKPCTEVFLNSTASQQGAA